MEDVFRESAGWDCLTCSDGSFAIDSFKTIESPCESKDSGFFSRKQIDHQSVPLPEISAGTSEGLKKF